MIARYLDKIVITLLLLTTYGASGATKSLQLSGGGEYADHIGFSTPTERDVDLVVKFRYDELNEQLTVSVLSYFTLLGFEQDQRYGSVVKFKKLHPERLSYVAEAEPNAKFITQKYLRKNLKPKHRKYVFRSWIDAKGASYNMGKYKVVNDYLERVYDVNRGADVVEINLNDVLVTETPKVSKKKSKYTLFGHKNLGVNYKIEILRDPCLGEGDAIDLSTADLEAIKLSYNGLCSLQGSHPDNNSRDSLDLFNSVKTIMMKQYITKANSSECSQVFANVEQFNNYVDSISMIQGYYVEPPLDYKVILDATRTLDNYTTNWSISKDEVERGDIVTQSNSLIEQTETQIATQNDPKGELLNAIELFRRAENAFYLLCY